MKVKVLTHAAIFLLLTGSFSCDWVYHPGNEIAEKSPCNPSFDSYYNMEYGTVTWMVELINEWMENGVDGRIYRCDYKDGRGFLFEQFGNDVDDIVYSFRACDGTILYDKEENQIEDTYPELSIKRKLLLLGKYQCWGQADTSEEFACNDVNPFTFTRVKDMIYNRRNVGNNMMVSICTYKDGIGFYQGEYLQPHARFPYYEFLDCNGSLLCKAEGNSPLCSELEIDFRNHKIILELHISLKR